MTAGASCPGCHQPLHQVPSTGICPHCGAHLAQPGTQPESTKDSSVCEIDETIETNGALDSPTLPPSKQNAGDATTDDEPTLPPEGQLGDAPPVGTNVRYFGDYELLEEIE